jgi:uncharacterized protein YcbK (DUF882 family)
MNRRHFCKTANLAVLGGLLALSRPAAALALFPRSSSRILSLHSVQTGEHLHQVFWSDGQYLAEGLSRLNHLLRDFRTNEVRAIDPKLLNLLCKVADHLGVAPEFQVISGYRSPRTNAMLARKSKGVAKRSFHMRGMAIDVRMPGTPLENLRTAALDLKLGGVGYYPGPDFLHLDVGPTRTW